MKGIRKFEEFVKEENNINSGDKFLCHWPAIPKINKGEHCIFIMEDSRKLSKSYDEVLLVCGVLKRLGAGNMNAFEGRLKTHKIQYFAQLFGVSPIYLFNLYLRGPYSPELSNDIFSVGAEYSKINAERFNSDELENKFIELKKFVEGKSIRELEITATLHWLTKVAMLSKSEAEKKLKELKNARKEEIEVADKMLGGLNHDN